MAIEERAKLIEQKSSTNKKQLILVAFLTVIYLFCWLEMVSNGDHHLLNLKPTSWLVLGSTITIFAGCVVHFYHLAWRSIYVDFLPGEQPSRFVLWLGGHVQKQIHEEQKLSRKIQRLWNFIKNMAEKFSESFSRTGEKS